MQGRHVAQSRKPVGLGTVVCLLVMMAQANARSQDTDSTAGMVSREAVVMAADRVQTWEDGSAHFVHLQGRVGVLQGADGLRAEEVIVRILQPNSSLRGVYRVQVYGVRAVPAVRPKDVPRASLYLELQSTQGVEIYPPNQGGPALQLESPPAGLSILARFLEEAPPVAEPVAMADVETLPSPKASAFEFDPLSAPPPALSRPPADPLAKESTVSAPAPEEGTFPPRYEAPALSGELDSKSDLPVSESNGTTEASPESQSSPPPMLEPAEGEPDASQPELPESQVASRVDATVEPQIVRVPGLGAETRGTSEPDALTPTTLESQAAPGPESVPQIHGQDSAPRDEQIQRTAVEPQDREPLENLFPDLLPEDAEEIDSGAPQSFQPQPERPGAEIMEVPDLDPLPDAGLQDPTIEMPEGVQDGLTPIYPGTQREVNIYPRDGPDNFRIWTLPQTEDGNLTTLVTGGVQIVVEDPKLGIVDISADRAVIWTRPSGLSGRAVGSGVNRQSSDQPMEIYLEGDVRLLQDKRELAGEEDRVEYKADRFYADLRLERFLALDAELEQYSEGLVDPLRTMAKSIFQYREVQRGPNGEVLVDEKGSPLLGLAKIQADQAVMTGSQFANPGYRFQSRTIDLTELPEGSQRQGFFRRLINPVKENEDDQLYLIDARSNAFFVGPVPYFFWPRFLTTSEDINPPLRQLQFRSNNLFGQMVLSDWDMFKVMGLKRPKNIDDWNLDIDYLSDRGFAAGSELGYFGNDLTEDLFGYDLLPGVSGSYFGYLDFWGLKDHGIDNLGAGPAIVTNYPPGATPRIYERYAVPPFQDFRGRVLFRHMHSLLGEDEDPLEDFRIQVEASYESDRHFLEQYYNRVFATGLDQATRMYMIRQWETRAWSLWVEGNLQNFYTDSQWLPKLDYYRLGGAPFGLDRYIQYYTHSGVDYANTHTAAEVVNTEVFNFLPYDPTSLTSGVLKTGRIYTNHEIAAPINFDFLRLVPYAQGQLVGWDNQYADPLVGFGDVPGLPVQDYIRTSQTGQLGRAWGALGARADILASRAFPNVDNELLNVHGLNHKIDLFADYRTAYSSMNLNRIGVQDDLDDNTYELVRRYFAMLTYRNAVLPAQYNPVLLTLRRTASPITSTVDVQDEIETVRIGINQRLQTKRGPIDRRHIIDYMTLDLGTTYFPQADRDNFGKPWGQTTYNYEWYIGDRTSIFSTGWFEFFDILGDPNLAFPRNREGVQVIMTGVNFTRVPRSTLSLAYAIINTGPINSSALNANVGYWLSPKWFATAGGLYDFGEGLLLATSFSVTRIGSDFLTSVGLSVNPLQDNYSFAFELVPRFSPQTKLGAGAGQAYRPDLRYLPRQ